MTGLMPEGTTPWAVLVYAESPVGKTSSPGGEGEMTYCWQGFASGRDDALESAKRAIRTIWTVATTHIGKPGEPFPDPLFASWRALEPGHGWTEVAVLKDVLDLLPKEREEDALANAIACAGRTMQDAMVLGVGLLNEVPEVETAGMIVADEPVRPSWRSMRVDATKRHQKTDIHPDAAEAMLALATPRWLHAKDGDSHAFGMMLHQPQASATLRAYEPKQMRKIIPAGIGTAVAQLKTMGAAETARRLDALLQNELKRSPP